MFQTPGGLRLRIASEADAQDICYLKCESWAWTDRVSLVRPADVCKWIEVSDPVTPKQLIMVGVDPADNSIGLFKFIPIDWQNRSAAVGWDVYLSHRGRGLGKTLVQAGVWFATTVLGLGRLEAHILSSNARSIRCAESAGFALEGRRRGAILLRGTRVDSLAYGFLL